jgi:catenin alpha
VSGITTARDAMKKMPEQDRAKILEQVEVFKVEKRKFDIEVSKWDDNGNDIIVLAKHMVRFFFSCRFHSAILIVSMN